MRFAHSWLRRLSRCFVAFFWSFILMVCALLPVLCNFDDVIWPLLANVGWKVHCALLQSSRVVFAFCLFTRQLCVSIACVQKIQQIQIWIFPFFSLPRHALFSIMSFYLMAFASILSQPVPRTMSLLSEIAFSQARPGESCELLNAWMTSSRTMSTTARSNPFPCHAGHRKTVDNPHRPEYLWKERMCPIYWFPLFIFIM